jgi:hypothetical protein
MARLDRLSLVLLVAVAMSTTVAPVGLCACWLNPDLETVHPHLFGQADQPHAHDYLFGISVGNMAEVLPAFFIPAAILVALLGLASVWWAVDSPTLGLHTCSSRPLLPPPRPI